MNLRWKYREGKVFKIPNTKVNQLKKKAAYFSYTPITDDLAELLTQFEMTRPEDFIIEHEFSNRVQLKKIITRAFTHYWKATGSKKEVTFRHLRKTYVMQLMETISDKALYVKHNEDKTSVEHYLGKKESLNKMEGVRLYKDNF